MCLTQGRKLRIHLRDVKIKVLLVLRAAYNILPYSIQWVFQTYPTIHEKTIKDGFYFQASRDRLCAPV